MRQIAIVALIAVALVAAGCKKRIAPVGPTPVAAVAKPAPAPPKTADGPKLLAVPRVDSLLAEPLRVERGRAVSLRWVTSGASDVTIQPDLGTVEGTGARELFPSTTTTYVLLARNGTQSDTRSITVEVVDPRPLDAVGPTTSAQVVPETNATVAALMAQLQDVLFEYNMTEFSPSARRVIDTNADLLRRMFAADPNLIVVIEGHADDRGSSEYNLGLADRRAIVVRDALAQAGVSANRLRTVSYGEEAPVCSDATEECWQRNRRAHLSLGQ
jgi:peptidoglycan-associated lipoprotein